MPLTYAPKTILVALDSSDPSRFALAYAIGIAAQAGDPPILAAQVRRSLQAVSAMPGDALAGAGLVSAQQAADAERVADMSADLAPYQERFDPQIVLVEGSGGRALAEEAVARGVELVVLGSQGRTGAARVLLGSFAESVARHCAVPVLIIRRPTGGSPDAPDKAPPRFPPSRILAATDFSDAAQAGVAYASLVAEAWGARLEVVHARKGAVGAEGKAERAHADSMAALGRDPADVPLRQAQGDPAECIAEAAGDGRGTLIVLASRGRTGAARLLLGSVAEKTARIAPCPVLIVK